MLRKSEETGREEGQATRTRPLLLCLFFLLGVRLATLTILPLVDSTETRYAQIAVEMNRSGDAVTPQIWRDGELVPYLGKPPLSFWLTSATMATFGANPFAARLPSVLAALALLVALGLVLHRSADKERAPCTLCITLSAPLFFLPAGLVGLDMTLAAFTTIALLCFFASTRETRPRLRKLMSLAFFLAAALGFLVKGPVALIFVGLPVGIWLIACRDGGLLRGHAWITGSLLFLLVTVPWFWAVEQRHPGFLRYFFVNENLLRYLRPEYGDRYGIGHQYPYGAALVMLLAGTLPWIPWCLVQIVRKRLWRLPGGLGRGPEVQLFLAGGLAITLFLCFARQLLPTYLIPAIPLLAVWCAGVLLRSGVTERQVAIVAALLACLFTAGTWIAHPYMDARRTSRAALELARAAAEREGLEAGIIFPRKTPYSAYFHSRGDLIPHRKDRYLHNLGSVLDRHPEAVYIIKQRCVEVLDPTLRERLEVLDEHGVWSILRIRPQGAAEAGSATSATASLGGP